jgi:hypothetical protein
MSRSYSDHFLKKKAKNGSGFTPKKMAGVLGQNGFDGP